MRSNLREAIIALLLAFLFSCSFETDESNFSIEREKYPINDLKEWYYKNEQRLGLYKQKPSDRIKSDLVSFKDFDKLPNWTLIHKYRFPDGRLVYEVKLENIETVLSKKLIEEFQGQEFSSYVVSNLMFVEDKLNGGYRVLLVRYYPSNESNKKSFNELSYVNIGNDWVGDIDIFDFNNHHIKSFRINNGRIISSSNFYNSDNFKKYPNQQNLCFVTSQDICQN